MQNITEAQSIWTRPTYSVNGDPTGNELATVYADRVEFSAGDIIGPGHPVLGGCPDFDSFLYSIDYTPTVEVL